MGPSVVGVDEADVDDKDGVHHESVGKQEEEQLLLPGTHLTLQTVIHTDLWKIYSFI